MPARVGAPESLGLLVFDLEPEGATGGFFLVAPGGAGGPDEERFEERLGDDLGVVLSEFEVDFLGFVKGFDGSSFDPKLSCLRADLMPTCHKGWLR